MTAQERLIIGTCTISPQTTKSGLNGTIANKYYNNLVRKY